MTKTQTYTRGTVWRLQDQEIILIVKAPNQQRASELLDGRFEIQCRNERAAVAIPEPNLAGWKRVGRQPGFRALTRDAREGLWYCVSGTSAWFKADLTEAFQRQEAHVKLVRAQKLLEEVDSLCFQVRKLSAPMSRIWAHVPIAQSCLERARSRLKLALELYEDSRKDERDV